MRSVSAAPKLAMTMMMTVLFCERSRPKSRASTPRARPPFSATATSVAITSAQPKENGPIGAERLPDSAPSAAGDDHREIGAPGDELAMREIGEAQDRVGERHADRAEPDHRAGDEAVHERLRVHGAACLVVARAEIELGDHRIVGEAGGRAFMRDAAFDQDDGAVGDGERRLHVLLDQHDGDALRVDLLQPGEDLRDDLRRQAGTRARRG